MVEPMRQPIPIVVFSDVDGVLHYRDVQSRTEAGRTLQRLRHENAALVLCSSHTRAEIEGLQQDLGIDHPFVCESGGAAFIPAGYFGVAVPDARELAGYQAVEFGRPYAEIARRLHRTAERLRIEIVGFGDMSVEDVARDCHLPLLQARLAKLREYGERFRVLDSAETTRHRLLSALKAARLRCTVGERFDQVGAPVDNSVAANLLLALYGRAYGPVLTVGFGDALADGKVLQLVDRPVIVPDDDSGKGGVDVLGWAEAIVDNVEDLRRQESSRLGIMRDDHP
jgi:mannosyl-3-phosphoglycerate phosphatase family protein